MAWNITKSFYSMTNTKEFAETKAPFRCTVMKAPFSTFEFGCNDIENQTRYAEYECSLLPVAALLWNFMRGVYRWTLYAILPKSAALALKCVLIVYIWPEKVYMTFILCYLTWYRNNEESCYRNACLPCSLVVVKVGSTTGWTKKVLPF